ncbi:MBL fold metallo-hydrolase [Bosea vaviloviae]|uniref:MBL fold metallo-hydrolase n=1 Tax=Bosea vaviloviae TaxID=1526658 RepID=UPI0006BAE3FA|nr:MBL fold metallo-hydrolase [Bosea vaviloviae]
MTQSSSVAIVFEPPASGLWASVAEGIFWAQIPLPFRLNQVNVWLIDDEDGWALIDCGIDSPEVRAIWETLLANLPDGRPISRIIATHGHTDHVGCAGYLAEKLKVPFEATLVEWLKARIRYADAAQEPSSEEDRFLTMHGCEPAVTAQMREEFKSIGQYLGPMPGRLRALRPDEKLRIGNRSFEVLVHGGHADSHASFYCADDRILVAGDQVLPRISPVIAVFEDLPEADPLGDYLASLRDLAELPENALVLPGHGVPFTELGSRLTALKRHHEERLATLETMIEIPMTAFAAAERLFERAFQSGHRRFALGETLAHLHRLERDNRAMRRISGGGTVRWGKC